jgi:RNA polymerase sigma factor (sigma-70 family)
LPTSAVAKHPDQPPVIDTGFFGRYTRRNLKGRVTMGQNANHESASPPGFSAAREFTTTHWSAVLAAEDSSAPGAQQALETLCRRYWYALYAHVRRHGYSPEDAQDLTQDFFARFLEKRYFKLANPARGRFRTFLLTALKHFLANDWKRAHRKKRGSGQMPIPLETEVAEQRYAAEPVEEANPETIYERRWAMTLLEGALESLRQEWAAADKVWQYEELKDGLWGGNNATSYADIAIRRGITETAVKMMAHRLRQQYRQLLRAEIEHTVASPLDVDDELHHLIKVISQ